MALSALFSQSALVALPISAEMPPLELRIFEAESAVEAATTVWAMRARDLEAQPTEQALRLARWAGEGLREAQDALEALHKEARA